MSSNLAVLVSHSGDTKSSSWSRLLITDPLTGNILDKREATGVDGHSVALISSPHSKTADFIVASVTSRITRFLPNKNLGSVYSTHAPVRCLASSPDGTYYVGGVRERVHVWDSATGNQVCVLSQHYQSVSAVVFSPDSNYLISGGEDGIILVWKFSLVVSAGYMSQFSLFTVPQSIQHECSEARLKFTLSEHALPITSLVCGLGGVRGLLYSASVDHSCKIWDLLRGLCIATIPIEGGATCLATDVLERMLLVGERHGEILRIHIRFSLPRTLSPDTGENREGTSTSSQHQTEVTGLATLRDNIHFVSSDVSGQLITWHLDSLQPIRRLELSSTVTSLLLLPLAVSQAYSCRYKSDNSSDSLVKPPPPSWMTGSNEASREGFTLSRQLRDVPVEIRKEERVPGGREGTRGPTDETEQTEAFINTRIANNEHFKKLATCLDDMYNQALELDFNY